ncbi:hypothetical protein FRC07_015038 [Ceratobasidium sp. 392]|nr:hypothetical protein FRC07_015038 [Ceratobasidium sp. 392]
MKNFTLEVCVDSVESAIAAVEGGADRLEICGNLALCGGSTPSVGLVRQIRKRLPSLPLMVMVRPRVGDFVYTSQEFDTMLEDVSVLRSLGVSGVVFGVLTPDGSVDVERLTEAASPMEVTFHRAFDLAADPSKALNDIMDIAGITRILTSGHATPRANEPESLERLARLARTLSSVEKNRQNELRIMPGSGISPHSINSVFSALHPLGVREYHMSGGSWTDGLSEVSARRQGKSFQMGQPGPFEWSVWRTDADSVRAVVDACTKLQQ